MDLARLRELIQTDKYRMRKHTLRRLAERGISQDTVLEVIMKGEIIEQYLDDKPFPSCLILGWVEAVPFHVVVSVDELEGMAYIITVYKPSLARFADDYKLRRK